MSPYKIDTPAVVSFSGGRTSGYMLWHILQAFGGVLPDDVKVIFCNTGRERSETLDFVERCSQQWNVPVTWLEYRYEPPAMVEPPLPVVVVYEEKEATKWKPASECDGDIEEDGTETVTVKTTRQQRAKCKGRHTFVEVDFATASRNGEPLMQVIKARNMLPNPIARFCTVECKIRTTQRYLKSLGWDHYENAIGFRADEPARVAKLNTTNRHGKEEPVCPLNKSGVTKPMILDWWEQQPFRLDLRDHEGNCDLCFLKGAGKIKTILRDRPDLADWWIEAEAEAEAVRHGTMGDPKIAFFRADRPRYSKLLELAERPGLFDANEHDELSIACHCTD